MKKTLGKIAFVLVLAMLAGTVTGCVLLVPFAPIVGEAAGGLVELLDDLIETPRERQEREQRAREREKEAQEWHEKWSQYEEGIDTF